MPEAAAPRSNAWKWYICVLLLLATTVNYMDRQTLPSMAKEIQADLQISDEEYGELELAFGLAFAAGALLFGIIADTVNLRWFYPVILLLWSAAGFITGLVGEFYLFGIYVSSFAALLCCRTLLGLFEAGHWPCALKTTQRLLPPRDRALGNSILQSGTSIGAIATPLLVNLLLTKDAGAWRLPFFVIGAAGTVWVVLWLTAIRETDLPSLLKGGPAPAADTPARQQDDLSYWQAVRTPRFIVLIVMVVSINVCWHFFRVWLPKFLNEGRGYDITFARYFTSAYYGATWVGVFTAGIVALWLSRRGWTSVHGSRCWVYVCCALLTGLSALVAVLPAGWLLLTALLVIGFAALGLFPIYYSLAQELSVRHQGKISGTLGVFAWIFPSLLHKYIGRHIDTTKAAEGYRPDVQLADGSLLTTQAYDVPVAIVGWVPLVAFAALVLLWNRGRGKENAP